MRPNPRSSLRAAVLIAGAIVVGCGGGDGTPKAPPGVSQTAFERQLKNAQQATVADFPAVEGKALQQIADTATGGNQVGLASSVFVPGENRLAFGVIDPQNRFVYGRSAVYVARSPDRKAQGPYPAPADSLITEGRYRSAQAATDKSAIAAIYGAQVPLKRPGRYAVLVVTKTAKGLLGAATQLTVRKDTPIPAVGQRPPAISTDTIVSAGTEKAVDTRVPAAPELHKTNFKDVLGKQPVALLFATPQLCQSRVCGPVVDIALQLKQKYGDRVAFIHQEVYVDNQVNKGLRPPLREFGLRTEPWLFTFHRDGRIAARLEGSFGVHAFEDAVNAALR